MGEPTIILAPHFRRLDEIFRPEALRRIGDLGRIVWARDEPLPPEVLAQELPDASAVVFGSWPGDGLAEYPTPRLRALLEVAGGHVHGSLGYAKALDRGLLVGSCAPAFRFVVAEHAVALALDGLRGITASDRAMREHREGWQHDGTAGRTSMYDATVGFVGCGGIAREVVRLLSPFGVHALGHDPFVTADELTSAGFTPATLDAVFDTAQVVFVAAAPTATSAGLVGRNELERLDRSSVLVIISRASLVDFDAAVTLADAGAFTLATDVFPAEPVSADDPVRTSAHTILTPHIAGALPDALLRIGDAVAADLAAIVAGERPTEMQYLTADGVERLTATAEPE